RFFATPDGVGLIDKRSKTTRVVGTKAAFARKHFCSYLKDGAWSAELEDEWARLETLVVPEVRRLNDGGRETAAREAAKVLAAIHYVRSYAFEELMARISADQFRDAPARIAALIDAREAFERDHDRPAAAGDLEGIVVEFLLEHE